MSDFKDEKFPTWVPWAAGAMTGMTMLVVFGVQAGVLPARPTAPEQRVAAQVAPVMTREFRFADRKDGALVATDASTGQVALVLEPGSNSGFIRGVMRGLMRERQLHEVARDGPVAVTQWGNGELTLKDISTGRIIELGSFGRTNREAFAQLLVPGLHIVESIEKEQPNGPRTPDDNSSVSRSAKPAAVAPARIAANGTAGPA